VKGNGGELLWEDCVLSGMNDDAFNISTHTCHVTKIVSPTEIDIAPTYPLDPIQWVPGGLLMASDFDTRTLIGHGRVERVLWNNNQREVNGKAPHTLILEKPIEGLKEGAMVWQPGAANPHTTLRRCRIENSCRFQTPVTLDHCEVTAFLWFYGEKVEGPFPSNVVVRDCVLRRGRGNPNLAVSFLGRVKGAAGPSAVHDITFEHNHVWGNFEMTGVDDARLIGNEFREAKASVRIEECRNLVREDQKP
jgi:hypothetical protein